MLAQEAKARDQKAREAYNDEVKGERLRKVKEFVREEERKDRAIAAAEKERIQAQTVKDRTERTAGQVAEKAKMDRLRADVKVERGKVKQEKAKAVEGDVVMRARDPAVVKQEMKLEREVRANKAAIDKQEARATIKQEAQAMAVNEPKKVGGYQLAQLDEPDDRTEFADIGEGCPISKANGLMYQSYTEQGAHAHSYGFNWQHPKSIAPCDGSESDYGY